MLERALWYLDHGYSIIPVNPWDQEEKRSKPYVKWKDYQTQHPTEECVRRWWTKWPAAQIGVITGQASGGITVIDIDEADMNWPETPDQKASLMGSAVALTSRGKHYWFRQPNLIRGITGRANHFRPKVDVRNDGNYVIAPPSIHRTGAIYTWADGCALEGDAETLPVMPEWLARLILDTSSGKRAESREKAEQEYAAILSGVAQGNRNQSAATLAGRYLARGLSSDEVLTILGDWNRRNDPPLSAEELERTVISIAERELLKTGQSAVIPLDEGITDEYRAEVIAAINERFGTFITDIVRVGGDEPYYEFTYQNAAKSTITAVLLTRYRPWAEMMAAAIRRMPSELSKKEKWSYWANLMMAIAHDRDPGEDGTMLGALKGLVEEYLSHRRPVLNGEAASTDDPIIHNDELWLRLSSFLRFSRHACGYRGSIKELSQALTLYGSKQERINVCLENGTIERVRLYCIGKNLRPSE